MLFTRLDCVKEAVHKLAVVSFSLLCNSFVVRKFSFLLLFARCDAVYVVIQTLIPIYRSLFQNLPKLCLCR